MFRFLVCAASACCIFGCSNAPEMGTVPLELSNRHADVKVMIDGEVVDLVGARPSLKLPVGMHSIRVDGERYETIENRFEVVQGQNSPLSLVLAPTTDRIDVADVSTVTIHEESEAAVAPEIGKQVGDNERSSPGAIASDESSYQEKPKPHLLTETATAESSRKRLTGREEELIRWVRSVGGEIMPQNNDFNHGFGIRFDQESRISDDDFRRFKDLPNLHTIHMAGWIGTRGIWEGKITSDEAVLKLERLPRLREVGFKGSHITDRSMEHLAQFPIEVMNILNAGITDEGLARFSRHSIRQLYLFGCRDIGDEGVLTLNFENISGIYLSDSKITDRIAAHLEECDMIYSLGVGGTRISPDSLSVLSSRVEMREISVGGIPFRDEHIRYFTGNTDMANIFAADTELTADGIRQIANSFGKLQFLEIRGLAIPERDVIDWSNLQNLVHLDYQMNHVGNRQLASFTALKNLKSLLISTTPDLLQVSRSAINDFKRKLPECNINGLSADDVFRDLIPTDALP